MTKWRSIPSALPSRRRMRTPMAWKVPIQIAPAARLRRFSTRPRISRAALLVKVTARISPGSARPCWMSQAIRCVSTRVLPLPAPAKISNGPSSAATAARCGGFSPSRRSTPRSAAVGELAKSRASLPGNGQIRNQKRAGELVAAATAAHAARSHVVGVVEVVLASFLRRLQRLGECAKELIAQLHRRNLEGIFHCPVIIWRVATLAGPEEELDQLDLDGGLELGVGLRRGLSLDNRDLHALCAFVLAFALSSGNDRRGHGFPAADPPRRRARSLRHRRRLRDQAGTERGKIVLRRGRLGRLGHRGRRGGRWLVGGQRCGLALPGNRHWRDRKARRRHLAGRSGWRNWRLSRHWLLRWHRLRRHGLRWHG